MPTLELSDAQVAALIPPQEETWPALMSPEIAGRYLSLTKRRLRYWRMSDIKRQREGVEDFPFGNPVRGPPWVRLSHTCVRYRRDDLDFWVAGLKSQGSG